MIEKGYFVCYNKIESRVVMINIERMNLNKKDKDIIDKYQIYLITVKHRKEDTTVFSYIEDIYKYLEYMESKRVDSALKISYDNINSYIEYIKNNDYEVTSIMRKIAAIKSFHKYLEKEYHISDSSEKIENPKYHRKLPNTLTIEEVDKLLDIKLETPFDYRNKAMLELMYASGLRVSELINLKLSDVDLNNKYVRCFGKESKERIVPFGEVAGTYLLMSIETV